MVIKNQAALWEERFFDKDGDFVGLQPVQPVWFQAVLHRVIRKAHPWQVCLCDQITSVSPLV